MSETAQLQEYQTKNILLEHPADWYIDKGTFDAVKSSLPNIIDFYENKGNYDPSQNKLHKVIKEPLKDVYTVPFFSEKFCSILLDEMRNLEDYYGFVPNPEEDVLRQIPEITFQDNCPKIYNSLFQTIYTIGNPIFLSIWNRHVNGGGIQIANYNLKDKNRVLGIMMQVPTLVWLSP